MIKQIKYFLSSRLRHWGRNEQGSFTLESTLVLPMLFLLILTFLLFSMYIYQKVVLYYTASVTAERTAFSWDNSYRNPRNGMLIEGQYDGLYWRIAEDHRLESLFGLNQERSAVSLDIPSRAASDSEGLALSNRKLAGGSEWISAADGLNYRGSIGYNPGLLKREIEVKLRQPVSLEPLERILGISEPRTVAKSAIVDPVEFIRSVDMVRYYAAKFASKSEAEKRNAGEVLAKYSGGSTKTGSK
ncbi:MAG: TadE/TadG family type IV pilus assembly protein [Candidatus Pristimantibacillus sp.]